MCLREKRNDASIDSTAEARWQDQIQMARTNLVIQVEVGHANPDLTDTLSCYLSRYHLEHVGSDVCYQTLVSTAYSSSH